MEKLIRMLHYLIGITIYVTCKFTSSFFVFVFVFVFFFFFGHVHTRGMGGFELVASALLGVTLAN
jgi:hypothetical protein